MTIGYDTIFQKHSFRYVHYLTTQTDQGESNSPRESYINFIPGKCLESKRV